MLRALILCKQPLDMISGHHPAADQATHKPQHANQNSPPHAPLRCLVALLLCFLPLPVWAVSPAEEVYQILQRLSVLLTPRAAPSTYYVAASGGSNNTSCDSARNAATPKATLNGSSGAIACLQGGDTLVLGDGIWHEQISDYAGSDTPGATRPPSGLSWSQPTTIKAANPRKAILDKPSPSLNYVVFLSNLATQYISVEGLVLDGRGHGDCVWVGPSNHIRLQNNIIKNCGGNGIFGSVDDHDQNAQDIQFIDNEIFNFAMEHHAPPGMHAIYFTGSKSLARGNYIHAPCPFYGIHYTSEHGGLYDNFIENNRVVGCDQVGIMNQGATTVVRNNLLENNCIGIYLSQATTVSNNTVYGYHLGPYCPDSYGIFDQRGGSTVFNNIVLKQFDASYAPTYIYSQNFRELGANLCDAKHPQNCQVKVADAAAVVVDGANGNLTLTAASPALNAGVTRSEVPTDRLGVPRPQGGVSRSAGAQALAGRPGTQSTAYDIGAYESTGSAPPPNGGGGGADTTPPVVAVVSPSDGSLVSGTAVGVTVEASDNVAVVGLQWMVNGQPHGAEEQAAPYDKVVDTTRLANGTYILAARARDAAGNQTVSQPISVLVYNGSSPPQPPGGAHPPLRCVGALKDAGVIELDCVPVVGKR